MTPRGPLGRFQHWEAVIRPATSRLSYSFALRTRTGLPVYLAATGTTGAVEGPHGPWRLDLEQLAPIDTPGWAAGAVIYQIFPDRFAASRRREGTVEWGTEPHWLEFQGGDLDGITGRLDYLTDLGIDALYLNPINASPSTHRYDAVDFYHVDPGLGGDEALRRLVAAAHDRRIRIVLDVAFEHANPGFFAFQDLLAHGRASEYAGWFTVYDYPVRILHRPGKRHGFRSPGYLEWLMTAAGADGIPVEEVAGEGPAVEPTYKAWYEVPNMPSINLADPGARRYFLDVAAHWVREFDIDGWRMDVAREVERSFWVDCRRVVREVKPDVYLLAEIWGDTSAWLQGDAFDATMNYTFRDLCVGYFASEDLEQDAFLDGLERMLAMYAGAVTHLNQNLLSSHDVERFLHMAGEDRDRLALATVFQLTFPGAPGVYYGDEVGVAGGKDPDNRRAFPWEEQETWDRRQLDLTRSLIGLRHQFAAIRTGGYRLVWSGGAGFAFERSAGHQRVVVLVNRSMHALEASIPVPAAAPRILWGDATVRGGGLLSVRDVPPMSGVVILVDGGSTGRV